MLVFVHLNAEVLLMSSLKKGVLFVASLGAISIGTVAVVASLPSAAGAAGGKATVKLGKQAELLARGAAVGVPVHITCSTPTIPAGQSLSQNVSVQLSEVIAGDIVQEAFGNESEFTCDGSAHTVTVYVVPGGNSGPFGASPAHPLTDGTAFASAQLSVCTLPGFFPPPFAPFASPSPSLSPSPIPSPPGPPGLPSCESARNATVLSIQGVG
jgi:hypothetical protein